MQNHQVIAVEYKYEPINQRLTLGLYDPNHPGFIPTITVGLKQLGREIKFQQSTGERLRGFFTIPYQKHIPSHTIEEELLKKY